MVRCRINGQNKCQNVEQIKNEKMLKKLYFNREKVRKGMAELREKLELEKDEHNVTTK